MLHSCLVRLKNYVKKFQKIMAHNALQLLNPYYKCVCYVKEKQNCLWLRFWSKCNIFYFPLHSSKTKDHRVFHIGKNWTQIFHVLGLQSGEICQIEIIFMTSIIGFVELYFHFFLFEEGSSSDQKQQLTYPSSSNDVFQGIH